MRGIARTQTLFLLLCLMTLSLFGEKKGVLIASRVTVEKGITAKDGWERSMFSEIVEKRDGPLVEDSAESEERDSEESVETTDGETPVGREVPAVVETVKIEQKRKKGKRKKERKKRIVQKAAEVEKSEPEESFDWQMDFEPHEAKLEEEPDEELSENEAEVEEEGPDADMSVDEETMEEEEEPESEPKEEPEEDVEESESRTEDAEDDGDRKVSFSGKGKHYFVNASVAHPLSINKSIHDSANINLTLFYGRIGDVKGLDVTGIASFIENDFTGIHAGGFFQYVGGDVKGIQVTGGGQVVRGDVKGIQGAQIFNYVEGDVQGIQVSSVVNYSQGAFKGIGVSGVVNYTEGPFRGIQTAGVVNYAKENTTGVQLSGVVNLAGDLNGAQLGLVNASDSMTGAQIGLVNVSDRTDGVQTGLVNVADDASGIQIGLVNVSDTLRGVPLGLINIADNGGVRFSIWKDNDYGWIGAKFLANNFYSMLSFASYMDSQANDSTVAFGYLYGYQLPIFDFFAAVDIGTQNEIDFSASAPSKNRYGFQIRGMLGYSVNDWISIYAGGGLNYQVEGDQAFESGSYSPLFFGGIDLF